MLLLNWPTLKIRNLYKRKAIVITELWQNLKSLFTQHAPPCRIKHEGYADTLIKHIERYDEKGLAESLQEFDPNIEGYCKPDLPLHQLLKKFHEDDYLFPGKAPQLLNMLDNLLEAEADPNLQHSRTGEASLHVIASATAECLYQYNRYEYYIHQDLSYTEKAVKMLLAKNADINIQNTLEETLYGVVKGTPLHTAISKGHPFIARLFLKAGADPMICNRDGYTAWDMLETREKKSNRSDLYLDAVAEFKKIRAEWEAGVFTSAKPGMPDITQQPS